MPPPSSLSLWLFSDAHVGTDLKHGRESLAEALRQSEQGGPHGAPPIPWDLALDLGDMSGGQQVPQDDEGAEVVRQLGALRDHPREAIYSLCGNHDRSHLGEPPAHWWRRWVDPLGEQPATSRVDAARRPCPILPGGTWERYAFRCGNLLVLMLSDINEPSQWLGRGDLGGNPGGVVSGETFRWWCRMVESHPDDLILTAHHYVLRETTVASGPWEGMRRDADGNWRSHYHGLKPQGTPAGASYLYWVDSVPDAQAFERYLAAHPGATTFWLGGHTHTHPDDTCGGRGHLATRWGTHFLNVCALTHWHGLFRTPPMSRHLTFTEGCAEALLRCYLHTDHYAPAGWYAPAEVRLPLPRPFRCHP